MHEKLNIWVSLIGRSEENDRTYPDAMAHGMHA